MDEGVTAAGQGRAGEVPGLPPAAYAAALASVPGLGPKGLRVLLDELPPASAWADLVAGRPHPGISRWAAAAGAARRVDVAATWAAHGRAGIAVTVLGQPEYPEALGGDPEAPAVLFSVGDLTAVDRGPRVAIVGTRSATRYGLGVAAQLGADLAAVGVVVVSGLALGIDGAAHEGALAAWRAAQAPEPRSGSSPQGPGTQVPGSLSPGARTDVPVRAVAPVAVVAGGLDTPYPRQHAGLWRRVAESGVVLSEAPMATADMAWRFPQRNRIIAALADVVVVVECHPTGGSMHTVQAAARRGVPVGAVPGSIRSPASAGANALLADGCFVVRDASDVLVAVGLATACAPPKSPPPSAARAVGQAAPAATAAAAGGLTEGATGGGSADKVVLEAMGWERCSVDQLLGRTGLELATLSVALERLRTAGLVEGSGGAWERSAPLTRNLSRP